MLFNRQLMPMLMRLAILLPMLPGACLAGNETSSLKHKDAMNGTPPATAHVNNRFANPQTDISLAFLPDVHFQDLHASFGPDGFPGLRDATRNQPWTIRTMQAQVRSTRLFNESYFALRPQASLSYRTRAQHRDSATPPNSLLQRFSKRIFTL